MLYEVITIVAPGVEVPHLSLIVCQNPYLAFAKILNHLQVERPQPQGVMAGASVHPAASLGEGVTIHPGCVVGENVVVGSGTMLYPGVVLYANAVVGADCILHAGAIVRRITSYNVCYTKLLREGCASVLHISVRQGPWNVDLRTPPGPEGSNGSLLDICRGHPGILNFRLQISDCRLMLLLMRAFKFASYNFV